MQMTMLQSNAFLMYSSSYPVVGVSLFYHFIPAIPHSPLYLA